MSDTFTLKRGPDPVDVQVGARIRAFRKQAKVSQEALAKAMGVSFQQVQKYENGTNRVSASRMVRATALLGVSVSDLLPSDEKGADLAPCIAVMGRPRGVELIQALAKLDDKKFAALHQFVETL